MSQKYVIRTARLGLRQWEEKDIAVYAEMNQDADVMRYFPYQMTFKQTEESYKRMVAHFDDHGYTFFALDLLKEKKFIGFTGLVNTRFESHFTPCIEIGWRLRKEYWGKGLATEAALACLQYAFDSLSASKVYSFTPLTNVPSERVMQKIGMTKEGTFMHPLLPDHLLEEHMLYSISKSH